MMVKSNKRNTDNVIQSQWARVPHPIFQRSRCTILRNAAYFAVDLVLFFNSLAIDGVVLNYMPMYYIIITLLVFPAPHPFCDDFSIFKPLSKTLFLLIAFIFCLHNMLQI